MWPAPKNMSEIPTPEVARHYTHLKQVTNKIPALGPSATILILRGQDIPQAHKVQEHSNGPHDAPYTQRLDLGWVIVGEICPEESTNQNMLMFSKRMC